MPSQRLKKRIKVPRTKRYKRIRTLALINVLLLVFNIFSYFWISGPGVFKTKAAEVGLCLKICPQGQDNCGNLSAEACQNLLSPPPPEEEEEEPPLVAEEGTTIIPSQGPSITPFTTPLGLVSPQELQRVLIPSEANLPVSNSIRVITAPALAPILVIDGQTPVIPSTVVFPLVFQGKTNIKDAIIIITLISPENIYATTRADANGNWSWTVPQILEPGQHFLTVLAMSPFNAAVKQVHELEFYVEAPAVPPVVPTKVTPPKLPEILPPISLPPIEITKDIYVLKLEVVPVEKYIYPGSQLNLVADITSFEPTVEKEINLEFTITNQAGEIVFEDTDDLKLKDSVSVIKRLGLKEDIKPGNYIATVQLTKKDVTYLTSIGFQIKEREEKPLLMLPGRITIQRDEAQKGLFTSFVFLSLLLILFLILLWREYQKAKREIQITGRDLLDTGQFT